MIDKYLMLVNKDNKFTADMTEEFEFNQVAVNGKDKPEYLESETYKALEQVKEEMSKLGIKLSVNSAGRTVEEQQQIWDKFLAEKGQKYTEQYVAVPGTSEHHTGLAVDVKLQHEKAGVISKVKGLRIIDRMMMFSKLYAKMTDYGFILRYDKKHEKITGIKEEFWHIRYVGKEHAKVMKETGLCLEQYVEKILEAEETLAQGL